MNRFAGRSLSVFILALALLGARAAFADEVRVATLLPCVEDALRGVPGVKVVASIRASMRAPERTDVVDLGSPHAPNLERLASANANLVVADAVINAPLKDDLARSGAEVMLLDTSSVESTFAGLWLCATCSVLQLDRNSAAPISAAAAYRALNMTIPP